MNPYPGRKTGNMRALIRELIETVILALLIFMTLQFSVQNFRVEGPSMTPTVEGGQYLLVNKAVYFHLNPADVKRWLPFIDVDDEDNVVPFHQPRRGEIIVFKFPRDESRDFVKRVIGVPGDTVEVRDGQVFIDGEPLDEPYIQKPDEANMDPFVVPPGEYFVMGDNRRFSNDSRDWGSVPENNIIGRAWVSYWPLDAWRSLQAFGGH